MKQGLLPLCQEAMILGPISYHDYYGILVDEEEKESLARNLGPNNKVMFLKNHGVVTCGATVEEAFWLMNLCIAACETQVSKFHYCSQHISGYIITLSAFSLHVRVP